MDAPTDRVSALRILKILIIFGVLPEEFSRLLMIYHQVSEQTKYRCCPVLRSPAANRIASDNTILTSLSPGPFIATPVCRDRQA
ncbi:hypothetical protein PCANC_19509 [Puccinia coronata f. sp. avenae]|uniref:Uncharacterized protein n=1 Tax=Puccinia coronata f. sp. avenae TaxID=200324 RepID=A0A2N5T6A7_9BASI|nr:hypothetical protein PCANC_19509 [Puccinia coronata f. sp. avenae]PLW21010.1 hypothetical protein PCASD_15107 [Puccinia coronata f. sp. avenae]